MVNVCMVGYGMMGLWHTEALKGSGVTLHSLVGRRSEQASEFATAHGYGHWTTSLDDALADASIDAVIIATPSEQHEEQAIRSLSAGKHVLLEIPIAMSLAGAERVVAAAERNHRILAMSHPMRFQFTGMPLLSRLQAGDERLRHFAGRFFIKRLVNIGATGYVRSWIDNILWHHFCHFIDLGLFLSDGSPVRRVQSHLGPLHSTTGIPMECTVLVETESDQSILVHGSYHAAYRLYDQLIVTERDTYLCDILANTVRTVAGTISMPSEQANAAQIPLDFIAAVRDKREPLVPGRDVLPAMRVLQAVQNDWDQRWGGQSIKGRPLG